MYGKAPITKFTRLAANADVGAKTITVIDASDWAVGDEVVIGPSNTDALEAEKLVISAISGNSITLTTAL